MPPGNIRISAMQTEPAAAQKARDLNGSHRDCHASSQHSAFRWLRRTDALGTLCRDFALRFPSSTDNGQSARRIDAGEYCLRAEVGATASHQPMIRPATRNGARLTVHKDGQVAASIGASASVVPYAMTACLLYLARTGRALLCLPRSFHGSCVVWSRRLTTCCAKISPTPCGSRRPTPAMLAASFVHITR
jgi:hypothetical protein